MKNIIYYLWPSSLKNYNFKKNKPKFLVFWFFTYCFILPCYIVYHPESTLREKGGLEI